MGTATPGSRRINEVVCNTRTVESLSRIRVEIAFDAMEKRKPTANDVADCIDMMLSRYVTFCHYAHHLGKVHLLNRSTIALDIKCQAGLSTAFMQGRNK